MGGSVGPLIGNCQSDFSSQNVWTILIKCTHPNVLLDGGFTFKQKQTFGATGYRLNLSTLLLNTRKGLS